MPVKELPWTPVRFYKVPNGALIRHEGRLWIKQSMCDVTLPFPGSPCFFMRPWAMVEVVSPDNRCDEHKETLIEGKCTKCEGRKLYEQAQRRNVC